MAQKASAVIVVNATQTGNDVTFSYSGLISDLNGLIGGGFAASFSPTVQPNRTFGIGPVGSSAIVFRGGPITGPSTIGPGTTLTSANTSSGDRFSLVFPATGTRFLGLPNGYTAGTTISGTSTYTNKSLVDLGLAQGSYVWTLNNTAKDTITLNVTVTPVPFESDALPIVGATLFMAGGLWWKKKRNQAKLAEFIATK